MSITRNAVPLILAGTLLTGCAGVQKTDWPTCAAVGGVGGAALGAIESSSWAGGGALVGAGMGAAYCWVHGADSQKVAQVEEVVVEQEEVVVAEPAEAGRGELDGKFDFDKAQVKQESYGDIKALADFMKQYPSTSTVVEGHTDSVGSDTYNQGLSERRAKAVRDVLVNQYGVEGNRVNAVGYGESRPVADNATAEGRAINRRVEAEVEARP